MMESVPTSGSYLSSDLGQYGYRPNNGMKDEKDHPHNSPTRTDQDAYNVFIQSDKFKGVVDWGKENILAGSIFRFINRIGVNEPIRDAMETARIIPVPTTQPSTGLVCKRGSEVK